MSDLVVLLVVVLVAMLILKSTKTLFKTLLVIGLLGFLVVRFIPQFIL